MGEIKKIGIIPKYNNLVYKENHRLSDNKVGKYISLDGFKKFYNPATGLELASPSGSSNIDKTYIADQSDMISISKELTPISGYHYQSMGSLLHTKYWVRLDNQNPITDAILGIKPNSLDIITSQQGRILNVQEAGNYTIKYSGNMRLALSSVGDFLGFVEFFINVNGIISSLFPMQSTDYSGTSLNIMGPITQHVLIGRDNLSDGFTYEPVLDNLQFNYSGTFYLPVGAYVEIYGLVNYGGVRSGNFSMDLYNYQLSISLEGGTTSSVFTNPLNISTMKNKSINYYGLGRDTLKLIGNKLTS